MKKALDYVSDYQLKSACKDVICIAPFKVTQIIFAVLEDWYDHIVLTHSCKLVSFVHIYLLFYCQRSGNEPDTCKIVIAGSVSLPFTFLRQSSIYLRSGTERWMCLLLLLLLLRCCSLYLEIKVGCSRLRLTSSNCQTLNLHLCQMQGSWWYLLHKLRYSPFCLIFCCHGNKGRSGKNSVSSMWWPISENSPTDAKISQISLTQAEL